MRNIICGRAERVHSALRQTEGLHQIEAEQSNGQRTFEKIFKPEPRKIQEYLRWEYCECHTEKPDNQNQNQNQRPELRQS